MFQLLVESGKHHADDPASDNRSSKHGSDNPVALTVAILREIPHIGSGNVAELTEGIDHGDGHGALGWGTGKR